MFVTPGQAIAEPFAPKVSAPTGASGIAAQVLAAAKVPDRARVPMPPYPVAKVIQTLENHTIETGGKQTQCRSYIKLLTVDTPEKVEGFCKKELAGYIFKTEFGGMMRLFWTARDELKPLDMAAMCTTTNVLIGQASDKEFLPEAKTVIEITCTLK